VIGLVTYQLTILKLLSVLRTKYLLSYSVFEGVYSYPYSKPYSKKWFKSSLVYVLILNQQVFITCFQEELGCNDDFQLILEDLERSSQTGKVYCCTYI